MASRVASAALVVSASPTTGYGDAPNPWEPAGTGGALLLCALKAHWDTAGPKEKGNALPVSGTRGK